MRTAMMVLVMVFLGSTASAQTCPTPAQLDADLTAAAQGSIVSLSGVSPLNCPLIPITEQWTGGKYIFSDSPESPTVKGKLYEDGTLAATSGTVYNRIFVLHVNQNPSTNMKFGVLIKNTGLVSATLTIRKKGWKGPGLAWVQMGMDAFKDWQNSVAGAGVTVAAGATVRLDSSFEVSTPKGQAMHGIWDYSMTTPHQVTVCAVNAADTMLTTCPGLAVLARDVHNRGTFLYADKIYDTSTGVAISTVDGVQQFSVGAWSGSAYDTAVTGTDVVTGSAETLAGNIGVIYKMHLNMVAPDGQNLGWVINPRGGWWGGAFKSMLGLLSQSASICPTTGGGMSDNTKACVVNRYTPGGGLNAWVSFMITASANAPVRFIAVPH